MNKVIIVICFLVFNLICISKVISQNINNSLEANMYFGRSSSLDKLISRDNKYKEIWVGGFELNYHYKSNKKIDFLNGISFFSLGNKYGPYFYDYSKPTLCEKRIGYFLAINAGYSIFSNKKIFFQNTFTLDYLLIGKIVYNTSMNFSSVKRPYSTSAVGLELTGVGCELKTGYEILHLGNHRVFSFIEIQFNTYFSFSYGLGFYYRFMKTHSS